MDATTGSSIFYCGFRGPNVDIASRPAVNTNQPFFVRISGLAGGSTSNNQLVGNDFNGIQGVVGAVVVFAPPGTSVPTNTTISGIRLSIGDVCSADSCCLRRISYP